MTIFWISSRNGVSRAQAIGRHNAEFGSEAELVALSSNWPMRRLVEIWNGLPGVDRVVRFTSRRVAAGRIWREILRQNPSKTEVRRMGEGSVPAKGHPYGAPNERATSLGLIASAVRSDSGGHHRRNRLAAAQRPRIHQRPNRKTDGIPRSVVREEWECGFIESFRPRAAGLRLPRNGRIHVVEK